MVIGTPGMMPDKGKIIANNVRGIKIANPYPDFCYIDLPGENRIISSNLQQVTLTLAPDENDKYFTLIDHDWSNMKMIQSGPCTILLKDGKRKAIVRCTEKDSFNSYRGIVYCMCRYLLSTNQWNKLVRPVGGTKNKQFAVAETLCRYILGEDEFKRVVAAFESQIKEAKKTSKQEKK